MDKNWKQLRSLIILHETKILETIMKNVENCSNRLNQEIVIDLLLWRHCQSLSQGNCYKMSRNGNSNNDKLKKSFEHKNFESFRNFIVKYHEKFGFDIISLLLYRTMSYSFVPLLINKLVIQHNNNWNILHEYQSIIIKHFESFSNKLLFSSSSDCNKCCIEYFGSINCIKKQEWLFSIIFITYAVTLTDDQVWIDCFKFVMEEIGDIVDQISQLQNIANSRDDENDDDDDDEMKENKTLYLIKDKKIRNSLINILNSLWLKLKSTKYMMDGYMLKRLTLAVSNPINSNENKNGNQSINDIKWPLIDKEDSKTPEI